MHSRLKQLFAICLLSAAPLALNASVIASNTAGTNVTGGNYYLGQSFTTTSGGSYDNITFSFLNISAAPYATGTAYLFSAQYPSDANHLSPSDANFLGLATAAGGAFTFAPSLTLNGGTEYFLYDTALVPAGDIAGGNSYAGGNIYFATNPGYNYAQADSSANFVVTGTTVVPTPEPNSLLLLGTGLLGLAGSAYRKVRA